MAVLLVLLNTWCSSPSLAQQQQPCEGFRTQTQGGWGSVPNGNNPGVYLYANFDAAFPSGLTIGGCGNTLVLTSEQAVTDFIPSGSTPSALPAGTLTDPGLAYSNVLAGQVTALTLSVTFDLYDANFGSNPDNLEDLIVGSGDFAGWTVSQVLAEANAILGGCASSYTPSQINEVVSSINENYVDGTTNEGFLLCDTTPPPPPQISVEGVGNVTCLALGSVDITVTGGTSPYTYLWNNGATTQDLSGVGAGSYSVTVTDVDGLTASTSVTVNPAASAISLNGSSISPLCNGSFNGSASVSASGGTAPYTYIWSNGKTTSTINNIGAGSYGVTVTDAAGCSASTSVNVNQPSKIIVVLACTNTCPEICNGTIFANVTGGTAPYTYEWSNGATTQGIDGLCAGVYWVTVTDANGCKKIAGINIQVIPAIVISGVATDVNCFDACNGSISQTVSGGCPPFTYAWSNGATTKNQSALCAGSYSVTVTDAKGCTASASYEIDQPALLVVDVTSTNPLCYGQLGSADASANGGTTPYSYIWSNGQTGTHASGLAAGAFSVTVTDAHGCTATDGGEIEIPAQIIVTPSDEDATCYNACNGSASVEVIGGTGAYSYNWSNGANTASIDSLCAGSYSVTVYDANQCSAVAEVVIGQPTAISVAVVKTNVLCFGGNTGTASASANGGTAPYAYIWSNGATTSSINGLVAGIYSVTATDANGCTAVGQVAVMEPTKLQGYINCVKTCPGACNGVASVTVIGGTAPYTYLWSNGETTSTIDELCVGIYWVTITDANGCQKIVGTQLVTFPATTLSGSSTNVTCFEACNGTIDLVVSGGTAPFIYNWSNGASSQDLSGLCAGSYSVTTTDAHGCTATTSFVITEPELLTVDVEGFNPLCYPQLGSAEAFANGGTAPYAYDWSNGGGAAVIDHLAAGVYVVTVTDANGCTAVDSVEIVVPTEVIASAVSSDVTCYNACDGTASVEAIGGAGSYTYNWSNGATESSIEGLCAGTYGVTVTDANGCTDADEVVINQPSQLVASSDATDVNCFNDNSGSISVVADGGTSPYSIVWDNGSNDWTIDGLVAGVYCYTVTDANGCSVVGCDTVNEPEQLLALIVCQCQLALCPGDCSFTSDLEVFGGTPPYTYLWSDGATTQDREGLCEGMYSVTVTDANGCTFDVLAPPYEWADSIIVTNVSSTNALCAGECNGTASVEVEGGYGDLSIVWSTGDNTFSIADLCAGTYTFTVSDAIGCSIEGSVTIGEPEALLAVSECPVLILCPGDCTGVIDVTVFGGTAPYTYLWNDGATTEDREGLCAGLYEVTITDANGCEFVKTHAPFENPAPLEANASSTDDTNCLDPNCDGTASVNPVGGTGAYSIVWSNGSTDASISGLCVGSYSVTITDANGCSIVDAVEIGCTPPPPCVSPVIEITGNVAPCTSSDEVVLGIGGLDGYSVISYSWNTGADGSSIVVTGSGVYSVTVAVDDSFCLAVDSAVVEYAPLPIVSDESSDVTCFDACNGSASVSVSAVTGYTVAWSNGAEGASIDGLCAGSYSYTVTSDLGCTVVGDVEIGQPTQLEASADSWNVTCFENCDGGATIAINGGTAPYTVEWSTGDFGGELNGLCAGVYTFTVTDAHQCTVVGEVTVEGPDQLLALSSCPTGILCPGECTGSIDVEVFGGTAPYSYNWSNGATTQDIANLCAGQYNVTITDANGCTFELLHAPFVDPAPIVVTVESNDPNCANEWSGSISLTISGGTAPYSIVWDVAYEGTELENLVAGTYCFTVTDANGCTYADCVTLEEPAALLGYVDCPCPISLCPGQCTAEINLTVVGGVGPFSFDWSNGATTEDLTNLCAGAYSVTITDANGCTFDVYHAPIEEADSCEVIEIAQDLREATAEVIAANDAAIKAYPNPFAANSTIEFTVGSDDNVTLEVYSITGQKVAELFRGNVEANHKYSATLEGANLSAGMYIYRLVTSNGAYTGNIVRVK